MNAPFQGSAADLIKNPFVLEFLGLEDRPHYSEEELESAIIDQLEIFLLELGKGFLFEARQKRFTFDNDHFRVDLVFYNRLLRCYVRKVPWEIETIQDKGWACDLVPKSYIVARYFAKEQTVFNQLAYNKHPRLSVDEIKTLVVDDKWLTMLAIAVQDELDRVSQTLTSRIRQLAERYDTPLPKLVDEVTDLSARVDEHLKWMGFQA